MEITMKELMVLERILLEYDTYYKFELDFMDAYKLYEYLKKVGSMTNYAFALQEDFNDKFKDVDKLKTYHNERIMESRFNFECNDIIDFINKLDGIFNDKRIHELIENNKFWK